MRRFELGVKNQARKMYLGYAANGLLQYFQTQQTPTKATVEFYKTALPLSLDQLEQLVNSNPIFVLTEVKVQLTFDMFWNKYGYKVGSKKTAQKRWDSLSKLKQTKAYNYIETYKNQKKRDGTALQYPEVYLNKEPFMN